MKFTIGLATGFLLGLSIYRAPHVKWFRDQPPTPEGWEPKMRTWKNGVEER